MTSKTGIVILLLVSLLAPPVAYAEHQSDETAPVIPTGTTGELNDLYVYADASDTEKTGIWQETNGHEGLQIEATDSNDDGQVDLSADSKFF